MLLLNRLSSIGELRAVFIGGSTAVFIRGSTAVFIRGSTAVFIRGSTAVFISELRAGTGKFSLGIVLTISSANTTSTQKTAKKVISKMKIEWIKKICNMLLLV